MSKNLKTFLAASALLTGLFAAPALFAHEQGGGSQGDMMGQGTMGGHGGMMGMMGQMSEMMESCNTMMQGMMGDHGSQRPNEQWRRDEPGKEQKDN